MAILDAIEMLHRVVMAIKATIRLMAGIDKAILNWPIE